MKISRESGFSVLTLLLLIAALIAGLTFVLIGTGPNIQGQISAQTKAQLVAQAQLILHRITKCATDYSNGNNGTAFHKAYPVDAHPGALAVDLLVCPGSSQNLWSGADGVYAPAPINGFTAWGYINDSTAVISIQTLQPAIYAGAIAAAASKIGIAASTTTTSSADDTLLIKVIE
jgi:hypothetical protein